MKEKYHKQRWIVQLSEQLQVVSHCLGCENPQCSQKAAVYRPEAENLLALKGYTFGLDVIAHIGQLRYRQHQTIEAIQGQLAEQLSICVKEVALLCEVFLALVTTVAQQDPDLIKQLKQLGEIVLSIDGIQPEKGNETLYLLREVRLGRVLVAQNLLSSATGEIEKVIKDYCLAIRTVSRQEGRYPLETNGVNLYRRLQAIADSLKKVLSIRDSPLLQRLEQRLSLLPTYQTAASRLGQAFSWIRQIAHRLDAQGNAAGALKTY